MFESLESRSMLASDPFAGASSVAIHMERKGDTVRITTLSADNTILVYKDGRHMRIDVSAAAFNNEGQPINAKQQNQYDLDKIRKIEIKSGAGNDIIDVSSRIKADVIVDAGPGSDTVSTGSGNDTIYGGDGLDYLVGNAGDDFIDGGAGDDRITATGGTDEIWGNLGDDRITVATLGHRVNGGPGRDTATLRDAPLTLVRVERFTQNALDLVPAATTPQARIQAISLSNTGASNMFVSSAGNRYAYTVQKKSATGTVIVNLLPYTYVGTSSATSTQQIPLGKIGTGYNTFVLRANGREIDRTTQQTVALP